MTRRLLFLVVFACAIPLSAAAQQAPGAGTPPVFGEELDVRVVNLEVVVTDGKGNRVPNLAPGDFRLRVDGKEVPIEYFSEVREGRSAAEPAREGTPGVESAAPEGAVGTYYLVFIDDYFAIANQRNTVLKAFKADLARLGPEDRMAVVAYDGGRLTMLSNWSGSRKVLEQAFDLALARRSRGPERLAERRILDNDQALASRVPERPSGVAIARVALNDRERAYGATLVRQIRDAVRAAVSAMRAFAAPQGGRKVMLLLSGGWPASVESFIRGGQEIAPAREFPDVEDLLGSLSSTANLLGYTLYPVDVPGVQTEAASADIQESQGRITSLGEREIEGSLHFLAQETGGKAAINDNNKLALANANSDTRSYYWLGFSPAWKGNDRSHSVKVEVPPGLEVRSRTSFLDLSSKSAVSMKLESTLLFGSFPGALDMPMQLGTPVRTRKGLEVPVTLAVPTEVMTVVPVEGRFTAQLELRFAASDANGNGSDIPVLPLNWTSPKPPSPGKAVLYETRLTLPPKASHVVVAVYDPPSGRMATAQADVAAPPRK